MANRAWASRVSEWKASGLTSEAFCEGKEFSAGGLRHWAHRLRAGQPAARVRVAKVVRVSELRARSAQPPPSELPDVIVAVGAVRIAVRGGCDRATLAMVVDVLGERLR